MRPTDRSTIGCPSVGLSLHRAQLSRFSQATSLPFRVSSSRPWMLGVIGPPQSRAPPGNTQLGLLEW
jgi:hypothetical protein